LNFIAEARRTLREDESPTHWWSARNFFKRQPYDAQISTAATEKLLKEYKLELPDYNEKITEKIVISALERIKNSKADSLVSKRK
jgi:hypothetical protein